MNKKRFVGFALVLVGILLSLSQIALTGAVIGASKTTLLNFTTAVITIIGILMILAAGGEGIKGGLEKKIDVFRREVKGLREEEDQLTMSDPELYFGKVGFVSLRTMRREFQQNQSDPAYVELAKQEYGKPLIQEIESGVFDEQRGKIPIAIRFLEVIYNQRIPITRQIENPLSKREKERIITVFRHWGGEPDRHQYRLLKEFNLAYKPGEAGAYGKIYEIANDDNWKSTSNTPHGDPGRKVGGDVLDIIEESRAVFDYKLPE
jgi:hypothetical protein